MDGGGKDQRFGRCGESFRRSSVFGPNLACNERRVDHNHVEGVTERLVEAQGMVVVEVNVVRIVGPGSLGIKVKEVKVASLGLIKGKVERRRRQEGYSRCILVQRCHSFLYGVAQRIDRVLGAYRSAVWRLLIDFSSCKSSKSMLLSTSRVSGMCCTECPPLRMLVAQI